MNLLIGCMSCFSIPGQVDERNDGGSTPLALAAADGHLSLLARMVGLGADINAANQYGMRPLHRCPLPRFRACAANGAAELGGSMLSLMLDPAGSDEVTMRGAGRSGDCNS